MWWSLGAFFMVGVLSCSVVAYMRRKRKLWDANVALTIVLLLFVTGVGVAVYVEHVLGWYNFLVCMVYVLLACILSMTVVQMIDRHAWHWLPGTMVNIGFFLGLIAVFFTWGVSQHYGHEERPGEPSRASLVRSSIIEQNTEKTGGSGNLFFGTGSFTVSHEGRLRVYHVWQERTPDGVLRVYTAEDGEGAGDGGQSKAVIKDDVPAGAEPYVERTPVYLVDTMFRAENNGNLCVKDKDTGCRVNAKWEYDKIVLHVPAGSVVPSVDPNLPVNK